MKTSIRNGFCIQFETYIYKAIFFMNDVSALTRDESWVRFNERVLQEAQNPDVPLLERIRFLAIYSSNFDEFFRVRISRLRKYKMVPKEDRKQFIKKPNRQLKQIISEVKRLQSEFEDTFFKDIVPELKQEGVEILKIKDITDEQHQFLLQYYEEHVKEHIEIIPVSSDEAFPFVKNHDLNFVLHFSDESISFCDLPTDKLERFVNVPSDTIDHATIFLDDIVRIGLRDHFKDKKELLACYVVKISRDADYEIDDEFEGDLIEKLKEELAKRDLGVPTRMIYDKNMPEPIRQRIRKGLGLKSNDLIPGGRYHNFSDLFKFPNLTENDALEYSEMPPLPHPFLEGKESLLKVINQKNILLSFPYQKFDYLPDLIEEAANHQDVKHIKITLYRVYKKSTIAKNLLKALKNGKKVTVFIEAKARFDENNNLYWGAQLEKNGANVIYSYPGIKVHTKILLIETSKNGSIKDIAYVGTGNFNEKTAKTYCDHGLLTSNKKTTEEIGKVFSLLEGKLLVPNPKKLLVSPYNTRPTFIDLIEQEIKNKVAGKNAYIILKMNSLEDPELIEKLYEASNAGVSIKLIVRGFCCLVPGVKHQSENIEVISIIDRFLEHARVYRFCNNGNEVIYMGSADWMIRNLDKRVEVCTPIKNRHIKKILKDVINIQLNDNVKARVIDAEQNNEFVKRKSKSAVRAQYATYEYFKKISETSN